MDDLQCKFTHAEWWLSIKFDKWLRFIRSCYIKSMVMIEEAAWSLISKEMNIPNLEFLHFLIFPVLKPHHRPQSKWNLFAMKIAKHLKMPCWLLVMVFLISVNRGLINQHRKNSIKLTFFFFFYKDSSK